MFTFAALPHYSGNTICFYFFNFVWLLLLFTALWKPLNYVYFFATLMLFLGIWMKLILSLLMNFQPTEPVGYWFAYESPLLWDRVLLVSGAAGVGILFAWGIFFLMKTNTALFQTKKESENFKSYPCWYKQHRKLSWLILIVLSISTNVLNVLGSLHMTGLIIRWVLPLHLNTIIIWIMLFVVCLCSAAFTYWDTLISPQSKSSYYWVIVLAVLTSLSTLSRSIFVFWTAPYFLVLFSKFSIGKLLDLMRKNKTILITYCVAFCLSLFLVGSFRAYCYTIAEKNGLLRLQLLENELVETKLLWIHRWIGLEGIMATVAYPGSSKQLLIRGLTEKPKFNDNGIYMHEILKPQIKPSTQGTVFASLPGFVGFLNYSNLLWVVFLGTFLVFTVLNLIEFASASILKNPCFIAQQSLLIAYVCISNLYNPYLGFVNLAECIAVIFLLALINQIYNHKRIFFNQKKPIPSNPLQ
jgi:hypothetical protein